MRFQDESNRLGPLQVVLTLDMGRTWNIPRMLEGATRVRLPRPVERVEYDRALDEVLSLLSSVPNCVAVYRTGSVSVPGISDLDFVMVVEGRSRVPSIWDRLTTRTQYVTLHSPAIAELKTFARHRDIALAEPLELLWGSEVPWEETPSSDLADYLIAVEGLVANYLRLAKQAVVGRIKVRPTLCTLHTLRFSLDLARLEADGLSNLEGFTRNVTRVRQRWFEGGTDALSEILQAAPSAYRLALVAIDSLLNEQGFTDTSRSPSGLRLNVPFDNTTLQASVDDAGAVLLEGGLMPEMRWVGRSDRLSELRWRASKWILPVPPDVLRLLSGMLPKEFSAFAVNRSALVRQYRSFVEEFAPGYSQLGSASLFVP